MTNSKSQIPNSIEYSITKLSTKSFCSVLDIKKFGYLKLFEIWSLNIGICF